jgi:hypothetical protein
MRELKGNMWDLWRPNQGPLVITTNGSIKKNGEGVMGRGIAKQAADRYSQLAQMLGDGLKIWGNHVRLVDAINDEGNIDWIVFYPVKHNWWEEADLELIVRSAEELVKLSDEIPWPEAIMPRMGCGNGKLDWADVKPLVEPILHDDKFIVCSY